MKTLAAILLFAATPHVVEQQTFDRIAQEFSGERAQELTRRIVEFHRIQGSPMMADAATKVVLAALQEAGIEARVEQFPSDGRTRYQSWVSPIGWNMRGGELWVEGPEPQRLCRYSDVPMCVSTYSKGGEWSGELIDAGRGTRDRDYDGKEVRGKVVLASGYARDVVNEAVIERGAVGTVIYPSATDRPDHPDLIRYNGLWTRADNVDRTSGSFQISANQYARLKAQMARGPVRVRGKIDAEFVPGQLTLVHAYIRGTEAPQDELIVTAHLDHPKWSANDNASGSAAMIEIARTLHALIAAKKLPPPRRTIHFLWVPEYFGTMAWLTKHPEARACDATSRGCVIANINLDMIGEDTVKTNGRFYITRAPMSVPSFLDALLPDLLEQTREARLYAPTGTRNYWPTEVVDYFMGSDHDMFAGIGVPSTMFGHDPDWTHHSSADTPDKTDASEFRRVGVLAANAAYWIGAAPAAEWQKLAPAVAAERLRADSRRLLALRRNGQSRVAGELQKRIAQHVALLDTATLTPRGVLIWEAAKERPLARRTGARRLTIPPIFGETLDEAAGEHRAWLDQQSESFEDFDLALFEAMNFLDGRRTHAEIADLLTMELGREVTAAWVDRLLAALASMRYVELP